MKASSGSGLCPILTVCIVGSREQARDARAHPGGRARGVRPQRLPQGARGRHRARLGDVEGRRLPPLPEQAGGVPRARGRLRRAPGPRRRRGDRPAPGRARQGAGRAHGGARHLRRQRAARAAHPARGREPRPRVPGQARRGGRPLRRADPRLPRRGGRRRRDPAPRHRRRHARVARRGERDRHPVAPRRRAGPRRVDPRADAPPPALDRHARRAGRAAGPSAAPPLRKRARRGGPPGGPGPPPPPPPAGGSACYDSSQLLGRPHMGKISGAHLLVRAMRRHGVERIFGLCGDHVNSIFNACLDEGVGVVDTRHESGATHLADGWARVTGRPGVSVVTGGPGHTNSLTGLATAWMAASPMIANSGMHEARLREQGPLQEVDQLDMVRAITKWARVAEDPRRLAPYFAIAYREAVSGQIGRAHLTIPSDVAEATVDDDAPMPEPYRFEPAAASQAALDAAIGLLHGAERPVVVAGSGVWWSRGWEALERFVEAAQLPCFTIGMARGAVSDEHPLCLGYADPILNAAAREIKRADVVLLIGKRVDFRLAYGNLFGPDAALIQIDVHGPELGRNRAAQLPIQADARVALEQLAAAAERHGGWRQKAWVEELRRARRAFVAASARDEASDAAPLHPLRIVKEVREAAGGDVTWVIDGGDFAQWARLALPARLPGHWVRLSDGHARRLD